jgi:hypothetical protein
MFSSKHYQLVPLLWPVLVPVPADSLTGTGAFGTGTGIGIVHLDRSSQDC